MSDPPRLLDTPDDGLATYLLRSAAQDRPRAGALQRVLSGAALLGTAGVASTSSAAGLGKSLISWLLTGLLSGAAASISVHAAMPFFAPEGSTAAPSNGRQVQPARATQAGELSTPTREDEALPSRQLLPEPSNTAPNRPRDASSRADRNVRMVASTSASAEPGPAPQGDKAAPPASSIAGFELAPTPAHEPDPFAAELVLIDTARRSLSDGRADLALATLVRHARDFPDGHFRPEALVLEIEAHALRGDSVTVRGLASRFLETYPGHPLGKHVRELAPRP